MQMSSKLLNETSDLSIENLNHQASAHETHQLVFQLGVGMDKNLPPDTESEYGYSEYQDQDDFEDFMLGIRDDGFFAENFAEEIRSAVADFKEETGDSEPFFEFNPLDSVVLCNTEIIRPNESLERVHELGKDLSSKSRNDVVPEVPDGIQFCHKCGGVILHKCPIRKILSMECVACTPGRITTQRIHNLEQLLYRKSVISTWESPAWYVDITTAYRRRQQGALIFTAGYGKDTTAHQPRKNAALVQPSKTYFGGSAGRLTAPKPELERNWEPLVMKRGLDRANIARDILDAGKPVFNSCDVNIDPLVDLPGIQRIIIGHRNDAAISRPRENAALVEPESERNWEPLVVEHGLDCAKAHHILGAGEPVPGLCDINSDPQVGLPGKEGMIGDFNRPLRRRTVRTVADQADAVQALAYLDTLPLGSTCLGESQGARFPRKVENTIYRPPEARYKSSLKHVDLFLD